MATYAVKCLSIGDPFNICCAVVIMKIKQSQVLYIKYNLNNISEIDLCILKVFHWISPVLTHILYHCLNQNQSCVIHFFDNFSLMTENRIVPPQLHTSNVSLNC